VSTGIITEEGERTKKMHMKNRMHTKLKWKKLITELRREEINTEKNPMQKKKEMTRTAIIAPIII
jgi:hypothetical protein